MPISYVPDLPREVKEIVAYMAKNWPKTLTSDSLLRELDVLARRVYLLAKTQAETVAIPPPQENAYGESLDDGLGDDPARIHAALEAVGRSMGTAQTSVCPKCGKDVATMRVFKYHKNHRDEWCPGAGTNIEPTATPPPQEPS